MATLGELLFYIATQNEGTPRAGGGHDNSAKDIKSSVWQVFCLCYVEISLFYLGVCLLKIIPVNFKCL